jgi:hypothetical protein
MRLWHADLALLLPQGERAAQGLGSFHPCLINQVAHKRRVIELERVVGSEPRGGVVSSLAVPAHFVSGALRRGWRRRARRAAAAVNIAPQMSEPPSVSPGRRRPSIARSAKPVIRNGRPHGAAGKEGFRLGIAPGMITALSYATNVPGRSRDPGGGLQISELGQTLRAAVRCRGRSAVPRRPAPGAGRPTG